MKIGVTSKSFSKNDILINELKNTFNDIKLNNATKKLNDEELVEFLRDCDGVVLALEELNKNVIDKLPKLKVVSKFGVGLDNIDVKYCQKKNIQVRWTSGINKESVAEITLGFMLMLMRNLYASSLNLRGGNWSKNGGNSLYGKNIGIVGVGNIGKELVSLLKPFKCKIYVNDVIEQGEYYAKNNLIESGKNDIFKKCDIITLHVPLTSQTRYLINSDTINNMKKTAFIINTSRGNVVNLQDLKIALKNKVISGAALDVYDVEPQNDTELLCLDNIICTPHIGGNSEESVLAMGRSAIKHIREFFL